MLASLLFAVSIFSGYFLTFFYPEESRNVVGQALSEFDQVRILDSSEIFLFVFLNNSIKGFFAMIFGALLGIVPAFLIFFNGEVLGMVLGISQGSIGLKTVFFEIVPHGILEIPAIILSAGYGFWLGYRLYRRVIFRDPFRKHLSYALKKYAKVVLPMLLVAAFVETFITPIAIRMSNDGVADSCKQMLFVLLFMYKH